MAPVKPASTGERRKVGDKWVEFTEDGRVFAMALQRRPDGTFSPRRNYGGIYECGECSVEYFRAARQKGGYCSVRCSKLGERNPSRQRTQKSRTTSCDKYFSLIVRSAGQCVRCASKSNLQCAHGFSRRYRNVRWDFRNAFCLCKKCHLYFTHRPLEWDEWLLNRWGNKIYWDIRRRALSDEKPDVVTILDDLWVQAKGLVA